MKVGILTCEELPLLTEDDRPLIQELSSLGVRAQPLVWTEDSGEDFDAIVVRSPWDYHLKLDAFFKWLEGRVGQGTRFENTAEILKWNSHKFYLNQLAEAGLPVLKTFAIPKGEGLQATFDAIQACGQSYDQSRSQTREQRCSEITCVVKPAVSASSFETRVVDLRETASCDWAEQLNSRMDVLVQPFVARVADRGELSIVVINGEVTHTYLKLPKSGDFRVQEEFGGSVERLVVEPWHQGWARRFLNEARRLSGVNEDPLYARIDLLPGGPGGDWVLGELELFEPALKFGLEPLSLKAFCQNLVRRIQGD